MGMRLILHQKGNILGDKRECLLTVEVDVASGWELGLNVLLFLGQVPNAKGSYQLSNHLPATDLG